jgi:micrococcal nuclease
MSRTKRTLVGCLPLLLLFTAIGLVNQARNWAPLSPREQAAHHKQPEHKAAEPAATDPQPLVRHDAKQLQLKVVGVHDGDTLTGLDAEKVQHKIRLDAIDAPELGQPFGQASKKALSGIVFGKNVVVIAKTTDKYGRTVGHVLLGKRDVNLEMLEEGMAWHYGKYDQNKRLREAAESARAAQKGLWAERDAVPPWDWRNGRHHLSDRERK